MQDFNTQAKELMQNRGNMTVTEFTEHIAAALKENYDLGKKHLIYPAHLMSGDCSIVIETDTFNPIH